MKNEKKVRSDMIELGAATAETKGSFGPIADQRLGQVTPGLSD